jgi:hypothetical protein
LRKNACDIFVHGCSFSNAIFPVCFLPVTVDGGGAHHITESLDENYEKESAKRAICLYCESAWVGLSIIPGPSCLAKKNMLGDSSRILLSPRGGSY